MRTWRWYSKLLFALLVAAFAYFVWPTPWRHDHTDGNLVRIHRATGKTAILFIWGWKPIGKAP